MKKNLTQIEGGNNLGVINRKGMCKDSESGIKFVLKFSENYLMALVTRDLSLNVGITWCKSK